MDLQEQTATKGALSRREFLIASAALAAAAGPGRGQSSPSTNLVIPGPVVRVETIGGVPTFVVNGKPMLSPGFETYVPKEKYFRQFAEAGASFFMFNSNAAACDYGHSRPTWLDANTWDYSGFEERAATVLAAKSDALLLPREIGRASCRERVLAMV